MAVSSAPGIRQTRAVAKARFGASVAFAIVGFLLAVWLVHIPAVQQATGISKAELGTTLLALGLGSLISMQAGGLLISRFGARMPLLAGHLLLAVTLLAPAFATDAVTLGIALFLFGLGNGLADVSMNAEAVEVERDRGKAIMSSMHAFFSIGTALGAAYGWLVQTVQLAVLPSFVIAAALAVGFAFVAMALLPKRGAEPDVTTSELLAVSRASGDSRPGKSTRTVPISQIVLLALLAFVLMLAEGVASDWSALHAVDVLGESEATGAIAYGAFAVSMTVARFMVDFVVRRFGSVAVVRFGSLISAVGLGIVVVSPAFWVALVGWTVFALGVAGVVPQIFTAAGNLPVKKRAVVLSRIVSAGYVGMLAGPAVVGWVAGFTDLSIALTVPLVLCLLGLVGASSVRAAAGGSSAKPTSGDAEGTAARPGS